VGEDAALYEPNATIHCFEPASDALEYLRNATRDDSLIVVRAEALGAMSGMTKLYVDRAKPTQNSLVERHGDGIDQVGVPVQTGDDYLAANDTEQNRNNGNAIVDERTLNEIYYPAFKQAVQSGNAASIMASTSLINGVHDNENSYLLKQTAKQDWGFDGLVVTDWDGARSTGPTRR